MHNKVNYLTLSDWSIAIIVIAVVAFICAYRVATKKCKNNCKIECTYNEPKELVIYLLIGSLCFITGFKLHLDQWITSLV